MVAASQEAPHPAFIDIQPAASIPESWVVTQNEPLPKGDRGNATAHAPRHPIWPKPAVHEKTLVPRIDEMLICSPQGDVLYENHCPNIAQRVNFLEFISQKARQLGQGLPMGCFDRLELEMGTSRVVVPHSE